MSKVSLSITVDNEIISLLGDNRKSETINTILKRALITEEGILEEIEFHKQQIKRLEKELTELKERERRTIENIPEPLKIKLKDVKSILESHPNKLNIWVEIINRDYSLLITERDLKKMILKWG